MIETNFFVAVCIVVLIYHVGWNRGWSKRGKMLSSTPLLPNTSPTKETFDPTRGSYLLATDLVRSNKRIHELESKLAKRSRKAKIQHRVLKEHGISTRPPQAVS